ncbi:MAG: GntR family transcriptional regulator [Anaerolineales bacterium]|nr:GntR family transcriptional regulator [Anaerolineales bacterium]
MRTKNIAIKLDFHSGTPIYIQIMERIRQMVANGELEVGDQLPTVRQLATDLRINWNTVARAYKLLDEARLISTQQGRGTYIWEEPSFEALGALRQQALEGLSRRYLAEAARMGCSPEEVSSTLSKYLHAWKTGDAPEVEN